MAKTTWLSLGNEGAWCDGDCVWMVNVDGDGVAYTFTNITETSPDDEEIQHVQDFFAGKCKANCYTGDGYCPCPESCAADGYCCYDAGNWSK